MSERYDDDLPEGTGREGLDIAIVGMTGRFPGAADLEAFWRNLRDGVEAIRRYSDEEMLALGVDPAALADPAFVRVGALLPGSDRFDAGFFEYSPREAELMDPQQRAFLECAWEALEAAGYDPEAFPGLIGVYAGMGINAYLLLNLMQSGQVAGTAGLMQLMIGNQHDFLSTRASYKLNLRGPSLDVQTGCSTSLVAVHLACQALLGYQCDMALAGGVAVQLPQQAGYLYQPAGIASPDGHCRPFDAQAQGTVPGSGVGVVVLKRLADALADGDTIRAVIRGSAINNDGSAKAGYTAPGADGQAQVIDMALAAAEVDPETVTYVEAHGTATPLGDPVEVAALTRAFRAGTAARGFCALGSVKSNVGHLDAAAGVAGLIKTVLALEAREIPPTLHYERPNPEIDFDSSPFYVNAERIPWEAPDGAPRRAGVSSFGIGGTNAHVVLEEAPELEPTDPARPFHLLVWSARSEAALEAATGALAAHLERHSEQEAADAADIAYTLQTGRRRFGHRRFLVARDREEAAAALAANDPRRLFSAVERRANRPVAFLLPGLGDHHPGMARGLYRTEPGFRGRLDRSAAILQPLLGLDIREALLQEPEDSSNSLRRMLGQEERKASPLDRTEVAQPALFAVEHALASLWMDWGVRPQALLGYSLGEYVAACLAGVFSLEDALRLVAERAQRIGELPAGTMLAVPLPESEIAPRLPESLAVAATNGPALTVVAGPAEAVAELEARLAGEGLSVRRLATEHAFHTAALEPVAAPLTELAGRIRLRAPEIPYLSNVTGRWITAEEATDPGYWARHLCRPVRFGEGLAELLREPGRVLLEVGPGQSLGPVALQHPAADPAETVVVSSLPPAYAAGEDRAFLLGALGRLWLAGVRIDWAGFYGGERRRRVPLPTYPFERQRYWIEPTRRISGAPVVSTASAEAAPAPAAEEPELHPRGALRNAYVAPSDDLEREVAAAWQRLLGIAEVGVHDSFFELGGHSLLATRLVNFARERFGVELPLAALFETPTVAGFAEKIRASRESIPAEADAIPALPRPASELPLSFSQMREWFLDRLEPGSPAYNIPEAFRLRGRLDVGALRRALDEVVRRHESLRTTFPSVTGLPVQTIAPELSLVWPLADLSALPEERREAEARRLAEEDAQHSFDLARGPLVKVTVVRLSDTGIEADHAILANLHHIISDGWSMGVVIGETMRLYLDFVAGRPASLPPLAIQYADFAAWQRERLQGEKLERHLAYWRGRLGGGVPPLQLATDRPRPAVQSFRGAEVPVSFPPALSAAVAALAGEAGASPFMVLLAAFEALLHRRTGQRDLAVGTFVANRTRAEVEPLIGFFVNTLVLRGEIAPEAPFRGLLEQVREVALGAYAHQDLPFERLIEDLQPERALSHTPLFQVMLVFLNTPRPVFALPGLEFEYLRVDTRRSNFDLTLWMWEGDHGLEGTLHYSADLFHPSTAARFLEHFQALLASAAADPGRPVIHLPLLGEAERHQLVAEWNDTARTGAPSAPVHALIAARAAAEPDRLAVVQEGVALTYGELNARANRLAHHLRRLGVGPEARVGLCLERSPEQMVGLLAILKAGGAYVPLDPAYPADRLALMIEDSALRLVVTRESLLGALPASVVPVLVDDPAAVAAESPLDPVDATVPESLAYVIYTSGSTGRPKGVLVPHGGLASYTREAAERYAIGPEDRVLQFASVSFDASAEEIFPTLASGATLVLRTEAMLSTVARFLELTAAWGVTVLDLPTAWWHEVTAALAGHQTANPALTIPARLRLVVLGGEKALAERWAQWRRRAGESVRLVNTYGPTEGTVVATWCELVEPAVEAPIGRPVGNVRAHVLEPSGAPQPAGVPGELFLGGAGVVRGYLGDPALTAARFVPDPFSAVPGARLYRTGDLARLLPDGNLEFAGRADTQVKIRGFRVEPGEVEALLATHPSLAEAVVVAREDAPGVRRLVAYTVPVPGQAPTVAALRAWLGERLPEHMVPGAFVFLDALPRTAAGKVDRRALPAPGAPGAPGRVGPERAVELPRTPTEELLAGIWSEVLGVERVGRDDRFFELGGHSLAATQITARLQDAFGVDLPLRAFFEAPTLAELALRVETAAERGGYRELPPIVPVPRDRDLPLSFSQERIWFLAQLDPESASYHVPRSLRLTGRLDVPALERAYGDLLERHEVLRTIFPEVDGRPVQRIQPTRPFSLPLIDLRELPEAVREAELARLVVADGARLFDLARGPLLRAALSWLGEGEHAVIQTEHHLVHDGWAEAVLLGDLLELYSAAAERRPSRLPELPVQYADFAVWQREWLRGEVLEEQLRYWRDRLAGAPPLLELPTDRPRPPVLRARGGAFNVFLPARLTRALAALGRREGATLFMVALAGFKALLARVTGQEDLVVGSGVANRRRRETERLLGMVINTLALRTDLSGDPDGRDLLRRVRETCLGAYAYQDLPLDRVVDALNPERSLSHAPIFQVLFAFHDARFPEIDLPGLRLTPGGRHNRSAKVDLVLILTPVAENAESIHDGPEAGGLVVHAEYNSDLFDEPTALRLMEAYRTLLESLAEGQGRLSELAVLTAAERAQLLVDWNDTRTVLPAEPVHRAFRRRAQEYPAALALSGAGRAVTYGELAAASGRLAARLRALGVEPEARVAVCAARSPQMVAGWIAVLEAGGACVPLDPAWPRERVEHVLADAGARVLLADAARAGAFPGFPGPVIPLDDVLEPGGPGETAVAPVQMANLAYLIYTSGSTGRPKGIEVPHGALANLVAWHRRAYGVTREDRATQVASPAFDASVWEIWPYLAAGASLCIPTEEVRTSPPDLLAWLAAERVTLSFLPTPLAEAVLALEPPDGLALRALLTGGDRLRRAPAPGLPFALVNHYGPSECAVVTTAAPVAPGERRAPPIGWPIAGLRAHVLDRHLHPVAIGVAGELCVGGAGLARGYAGRPDLTAAAFIPDPFAPRHEPGARLYRTGDKVRRRPDGRLEFLERIDRQVKVRGFRIELGEIEAALAALPEVREAVVVAREDAPGELRLVAYAVPQGEADAAALRAALAATLPEYMVPAAFAFLPELPLAVGGKVDRRRLPAPGPVAMPAGAAGAESVPPRDAVEETIAAIWREVLRTTPGDRVGVHDDFFAAGGHSLLATQLVSRIRRAFNVELPVRRLFDGPTVARLAAAVRETAGATAPPLRPVPRPTGRAPLSFAQQRLWFLDQLEPGTSAYNVPIAVLLRGPLSTPALAASLDGVVRRHETLRTTFAWEAGEPVQVIHPAASPLPLPVVDLGALPDAVRQAEARRWIGAEAVRPFDLQRGPLLRCALWRLGEEEHALCAVLHHIVADGWSAGVLVREVSALYGAAVRGAAPALPELPVQYADFAVWQRGWLRGEVLEAQLAHWRRQLGGGVPALDLPLDRPRPAVATYRGAVRPWRVAAPVHRALRDLGLREGGTLFMTLLAGFAALLHRYTGQDDFAVGTTIANRNRAETEGLIGFFINTLALRPGLGGDPAFADLLGRAREVCLAAYAHQDLPFEKIVEELQPDRGAGRSPFFQVVLQVHNTPAAPPRLPGLELSFLEADNAASKFDLVMNAAEGPDGLAGLAGTLRYRTDLLDAATVDRLAGHFAALLAGAAKDPGRRLSELPLLPEAELRQLVLAGSRTLESAPQGSLTERFQAWAVRTPGAPAVTCDGETLTYSELDRRANQIAHELIAFGVGRGDLVGLFLERSLDTVVAILGVLKSGAAYLPMDEAYPRERLAFMLEDAAVPVVLTQERLAGELPAHGARILHLDAGRDALARRPVATPRERPATGDVAYAIYTSGSTGRPKGVLVTHANVLRLLDATADWFGFGPLDVWTLFHSCAFDFSVWEIWGALACGGRLVVVPYRVSRSAEALHELVAREGVTVLNQTPTAFRQFVLADQQAAGRPLALRAVIFGGEALEPASLAPWIERHGDERPELINMYGITETTVHVTWRRLRSRDVRKSALGSPIGRAIPDLALHVLDRGLRPAPVGVPGEIHVGGAGLALGYLARPELTAERFVPDPWSGEPGARLYRTGDLARRRSDGELDYLGRIDQQVKVRGFRIELGEIEAALARHPAVREAVVTVREDRPGDRTLAAYVVARPEAEGLTLTALRDSLAGELPDYMLPAALVVLDALPVTASGKVDRRALPAPSGGRPEPESGEGYEAPRTDLERFLAGLWSESLGSDRIGRHDDFFALGGNSISGAILINRLQAELGEIVHVVTIFDAPTVAGLAAHLLAQHPRAVARRFGVALPEELERAGRVDESRVALMRSLITPLAPRPAAPAAKNPQAVFVLAPPRSGTTLLRVMLGGHPRLFSPPELELLSFNTLRERREAFQGRDAFWLEGAVRAVMAARACGAEEAARILEGCEAEGLTTRELYGHLQSWIGGRRLVDKTPSYTLDLRVLERAEEDFEEPLYLHLVRHPHGMIRSFEEARLDQIFFRKEHPFSRRELAELIWRVSHENVLRFFERIPERRRHLVRFEDLVRDPQGVLEGICAFLGLDFHPDMAEPYKAGRERMTDGLHAESRMLGDVKFHQHRGVDAGAAEAWKDALAEDFLGDGTWGLAAAFGYERPQSASELGRIEPRVARGEARLPLSFAQERLWFLDQLEPGTSTYNIPAAVRLYGALDRAALARALDEIVRRHAALRTTFAAEEGQPFQVIAPPTGRIWPLIDLRGLSGAEREAESRRLSQEEAARPFDLARGPLHRLTLLQVGEAEHLALLTFHHIVSDGWSLRVFVRELATLYRADLTGAASPLPELPVQAADFGCWQRASLGGGALAGQLDYWVRQLDGAPPLLELPTDRPRPAVRTFRGGRVRLPLPPGLSDAVRALGSGEGATLFMTLLAAFAAVLQRHGGQAEVVVGTPVAGRNRAEVEGLIGFFLNTLVLRLDLMGEPGFRELLRRVRETAVAAYAHQDLPFERLLEAVQPERDPSRTPLFQAYFNLLPLPAESVELPGLTLEPVSLGELDSKFDLTLYVRDPGGDIQLDLVYNAGLFDAARTEDLLRQMAGLLAAVTADSARPLGRISLVTPEAAALLPDRAARLDPTWRGSVPELFARHARQAPDRLAVLDRDGAWTYGDLDAATARLAGFLRHAGGTGVGRGDRVAIYAHRSAPLVVAILGALRAGAAFVVLDPAYPASRLIQMVDLAAPSAWLAVEAAGELPPALAAALDARPGLVRLTLPSRPEAILPEAGEEPGMAPIVETAPDDLAYIAFTSGSTGVPKGVLGRHGPLTHFTPWQQRVFGLGETDRYTLLSGLAHDPLHRDVFTPLQTGAAIVIPDPEDLGLPGRLAEWMVRAGATVAHLTPSLAQLLTERAPDEPLVEVPSLRYAFLVGDVLTRSDVARLRALAPGVTCVNYYGSTETQRAVGYHVVAEEVPSTGGEILPLGRGIEDVQLLVLNAAGELAGVGELGEIHVRSPHLARGYRDDAELTRQRFLDDPFRSAGDERLYRTGDLGRYAPDGQVHFAGRADVQVKIRGFRVEPGEVEAALARHPAVREAAVVARRETGSQRSELRLVAYAAAEVQPAPTPRELRSFLEGLLPAYMVPAAVVVLDALPLTPNGKLDRAALPAPVDRPDEALFAAPAGEIEELVAGIWAELLGRDKVGARDDFFELGGHSLQAARVAARLRQALGLEVPVRALFDHPALGDLARRLEARLRGGSRSVLPPLLPLAGRFAPLSFAQERLWFLDRLQPGSAAYNMPLAVRLSGPLDAVALEAALGEVVRRHATLRTTFILQGDEPVQVIAEPGSFPLIQVDLSGLDDPETAAADLARREAGRPFDLRRGLMLRACLARLGEAEHRLFATVHHIASDGWSLGIFVRELAAAYRAFASGEVLQLPDLAVRYADFAVWQRAVLQGEVLEEQVSYWKEQLAGMPPLELPADRPRPAFADDRGARRRVLLPAGVAALARAEGATPYMTLLAGFQLLLGRLSGQSDFGVGSPIAGRSRPEVEGLIGFFVNTLVLRADLAGEPGFRGLLARVRRTALEAFAHADLPFEKLVGELRPERDPGRAPLFQVLFALQNAPFESISLPGLEMSLLPAHGGAARFDLSLALGEGSGGLGGWLEYRASLFDEPTIDRFAGCLETLLEGIVAQPDRPVAELPLLRASEVRQLLEEWGTTGPAGEDRAPVHRMFQAWAERSPGAPALTWGNRRMSYGELAAEAGRLARRLRAAGAGPERLVGLFLDRSPEVVVAILAVLEAGGAYLPLDPSYPQEWLAAVLEDSGAAVLLTREAFLGRLPGSRPATLRVMTLEETEEAAGEPPAVWAGPDSLAYAIYTSGSTGRPKGVQLTHHGIANLARAQAGVLGLAPGRRVLQFSSLSFDASVWEILLALSAGAELVLAPHEELLPGPGLLGWLREVDTVTLPPSALAAMPAGAEESLPGLRTLVVAGEACPPDLPARWAPGRSFVNAYGPTELTVCATAGELTGGEGAPHIGRPLPGFEARVLDAGLRLVPAGAAGELCVGGAGLARGYLDRPDLTAERFVPDPYAAEPGARVYRTGDRVRWRADGRLEYLGRLDEQVKVRGFRIEPGEVEAALRRQPGVAEAAVAPLADSSGALRLVAYVTGPEPLREAELRSGVARLLPAHLVPSVFVQLAALPRTPGGKIDRRALPAPGGERPVSERPFEPASTPVQQRLAAIWEALLGIESVGIHDRFFELGGHSLQATRLLARVQDEFGVEVPVRELFERPTVAGLEGAILERQLELAGRDEVARLLALLETPGMPETPESPESTEEVLS